LHPDQGKEKQAGFIQPMGKRKAGWFHPAHGEKKSGLVSSSPWGKEKRAGFIQPMGKGKAGWFLPAHVATDLWRFGEPPDPKHSSLAHQRENGQADPEVQDSVAWG
jgi:hypothetical protein